MLNVKLPVKKRMKTVVQREIIDGVYKGFINTLVDARRTTQVNKIIHSNIYKKN